MSAGLALAMCIQSYIFSDVYLQLTELDGGQSGVMKKTSYLAAEFRFVTKGNREKAIALMHDGTKEVMKLSGSELASLVTQCDSDFAYLFE